MPQGRLRLIGYNIRQPASNSSRLAINWLQHSPACTQGRFRLIGYNIRQPASNSSRLAIDWLQHSPACIELVKAINGLKPLKEEIWLQMTTILARRRDRWRDSPRTGTSG
ncbi:hypothetical protein DPMN_010296 [Dreissena polymorpha]|uniref:Uncharacterized protein n=1 Tax=Dreissena polymorpha TaxID=45954 RepID=A0A9D4MYJ9_DREPO|nr:hypothetical protein DPMN_010296 [Dreissena polymorpha]